MAALRKVGELTKQALTEAASPKPAADTADVSEVSTTERPTRRQQWDARLAEIQPRFSAAVAGSAPNVDKLRKVMQYAQNEARLQQFLKALVGLDRLERLLSEAT